MNATATSHVEVAEEEDQSVHTRFEVPSSMMWVEPYIFLSKAFWSDSWESFDHDYIRSLIAY